jgi:hypothetical protein
VQRPAREDRSTNSVIHVLHLLFLLPLIPSLEHVLVLGYSPGTVESELPSQEHAFKQKTEVRPHVADTNLTDEPETWPETSTPFRGLTRSDDF